MQDSAQNNAHWRIAQLGIAVVLILAIIQNLRGFDKDAVALFENHAEHQMLNYAETSARTALEREDLSQLRWLVQSLVADSRIISVAIFNHEGKRVMLDQSTTDLTDDQPTVTRMHTLPIIRDDKNLGYIRLTFDLDQFHRQTRYQLTEQRQKALLIMCLALITGFLIACGLTRQKPPEKRKEQQKIYATNIKPNEFQSDNNKLERLPTNKQY